MQQILNFGPYLLYLVIGVVTVFVFDGTADSGDSILHYLLSRSAPVHPHIFFHHWAKPVFVLLSWPWAQLGFVGIKLFNLTVTIIAARLTHLAAIKLQFANSWLIPILFLCTPLNFIVTFSGLTEPLFSLFLALGLLLAFGNRQVWAAVVISFLPFVRSEGLLIIGVFAVLFLLTRNWKALLATTTGHIVYSFAGWLSGKSLLWTFTEIPYDPTGNPYGNGTLFSFPEGMVIVLGIPILILFLVGCGFLLHRFARSHADRVWIYLIAGSFLAVFIFHTLAWAFGMFNAMGLKRVMIGVMPSMALMALAGFNALTDERFWKNTRARLVAKTLIIATIVWFPFTANHAAIHWKKDLSLRHEQIILQDAKELILQNSNEDQRYVYSCIYLSVVLDIDHIDPAQRIDLNEGSLPFIRPDDIVVWDNWTAGLRPLVPLDTLMNDPHYRELGTFVSDDPHQQYSIVVFKYE